MTFKKVFIVIFMQFFTISIASSAVTNQQIPATKPLLTPNPTSQFSNVTLANNSKHFIPEEAEPENSQALRVLNNPENNANPSQVIAVLKQAEHDIKRYGKEKAIIEFKKHSAQIFMGDYMGNFYYSAVHPELIGINQFNYKDDSGALVVQEEIEKAKAGGGWLKPRWRKNPHTGEYQCRKIFILPISENYFLASWYNYAPNPQRTCSI